VSILSALIPSMFHRRLALLAVVSLLGAVPLVAQLGRLTLAEGPAHREEAESKLVRLKWLPTTRGRILDRKGRVLAQDRASYAVVVDYRVLTGAWAREQGRKLARARERDSWGLMGEPERAALEARYTELAARRVESMWEELGAQLGRDPDELRAARDEVVARVERMGSSIRGARREQMLSEARARGREPEGRMLADIERRIALPLREEESAHVVARDVPDEAAFRLLAMSEQSAPIDAWRGGGDDADDDVVMLDRMPGMRVSGSTAREYPFERVVVDVDASRFPGPVRRDQTLSVTIDGPCTHLLGVMRDEVFAEDAAARRAALEHYPALRERATAGMDGGDRGRYFEGGDAVGHTGLESSLEAWLRGLRGVLVRQLDTGATRAIPPSPGMDVRLSIDVMLQARVHAIMSPEQGLARVQEWHGKDNSSMAAGTPLNGAAVVLDVDTGDVLAMVSTPTYTREQLRDDPASVFSDPLRRPDVNKAIAKPYPPGSIAKAIIAAEASKRGVLLPGETISCTGHLFPNQPNMYRCWIYKRFGVTHDAQLGGPLSVAQALEVSCNIFFYTLGRRLGPEGVVAAYADFAGVGTPWNLGVGAEFPGSTRPFGGAKLEIQDAIFMGMGQGPVAWTPLHAAQALATVARYGVRVPPRIIMSGAIGRESAEPTETGVDSSVAAEILHGLDLALNDPMGSGNHISYAGGQEKIINVPGVRAWGKTGTAEAPDLVHDPDGDGPAGREVLLEGDHSWFVVLAGDEGGRPRYAVSVVMEYAGSGGKVSGPIANQIVWALVDEGYLKGVAQAGLGDGAGRGGTVVAQHDARGGR
jgi:cell division protein FtsI/penicillin-binding protein 2